MPKEFIPGAHFNKIDKRSDNERFLIYLRNRYQSKAFQAGIFSGGLAVFIFLRKAHFGIKFTKPEKIFYSFNLFIACHIFVYEIWNNLYTDKAKVSYIDNLIINGNNVKQ
jgi:hypothetical protein